MGSVTKTALAAHDYVYDIFPEVEAELPLRVISPRPASVRT
jgi:hypothetical protein